MLNFTKGKWEVDAKTIRISCKVFRTVRVGDMGIVVGDIGEVGGIDVAVIPEIHGTPKQELLSNALLIAGAPDLYALAESLANCKPHQFSALKMKAQELIGRLNKESEDD